MTKQFTATGTYSDGTSHDITASTTWSSGNATVATVNASGLATGMAAGTATITATSGAISGNTTLTVTPATLLSIAITPANPSIPKGLTQQLTATGTYTDGTSQNLTASVIWSSATTAVATVNASGLATGVAAGTAAITATSGAISGSTTLTVTPATLLSIAITPANPSFPNGLTQQLTATGTYTDGTSQNLTASATWSSATTAVATVNASGLATGVAAGTAAITATSGAISGSTTLTVTPAVLQSIAITPANPSIPKGLTQQLTATGTYTDGTSQNLTASVTWSSAATAVATVNASGLAAGVTAGTSAITATSGAISGSTTLTVTPAALQSIAVTPANPTIPKGLTQQLAATGTYTDGTSQNLSATATWSSAATAVATVNASGLATGVAAGTAAITATSGAISGSTTLTVTPAVLVSITVTPVNPSVPLGLSQQLTATGNYSDGTTQNLSNSVTWTSSNTAIALVYPFGLAASVAAGSATITATAGAISGSTVLTTSTATLLSIAITPINPGVGVGLTQQLTAKGTYSDASVWDVTALVIWSSSAPTIATVNAVGVAAGVAAGTSTISATSGLAAGSATLTVSPTYTVSGTVSALPAGTSISLRNGTDTITVTPTGYATGFIFPTRIPTGGTYSLSVVAQPATGHTCTVVDGAGTVNGANVTTLQAVCDVAVDTLAGNGTAGFLDSATGRSAQFNTPMGGAVDAAGNLYIADMNNCRIRKITPAGAVSTFAGSGTCGYVNSPTAALAQFNLPTDVAIDAAGNLYVADQLNHSIRKITPAGAVSTLAGTGTAGFLDSATGTLAQFSFPVSVALDSAGNVYVADSSNNRIRKITPAGAVTTYAGSGVAGFLDSSTATLAKFFLPSGVAVDSTGNVYVADTNNNRIRIISPFFLGVSTYAGSGTNGYLNSLTNALSAQFSMPADVAVDSANNVYVADLGNNVVRQIASPYLVNTMAGSFGFSGALDGVGALTNGIGTATFNRPNALTMDTTGKIYVSDAPNNLIRKITP